MTLAHLTSLQLCIPLISSLTEKTELMNLHKRNACVYMSSVSLLIPLIFFLFTSGQGLLSQSALQLNNQDAYAAAGYHSNQGLTLGETVTGSGGQVGGAVHSYNQVHMDSFLFFSILPSFVSIFPLLSIFLHRLPGVFSSLRSSFSALRPSLGDIQPCSCPVSGDRFSLPVPERLICSRQRLPHAHRGWAYTCWTIHVLLLRHFASTGTKP